MCPKASREERTPSRTNSSLLKKQKRTHIFVFLFSRLSLDCSSTLLDTFRFKCFSFYVAPLDFSSASHLIRLTAALNRSSCVFICCFSDFHLQVADFHTLISSLISLSSKFYSGFLFVWTYTCLRRASMFDFNEVSLFS